MELSAAQAFFYERDGVEMKGEGVGGVGDEEEARGEVGS